MDPSEGRSARGGAADAAGVFRNVVGVLALLCLIAPSAPVVLAEAPSEAVPEVAWSAHAALRRSMRSLDAARRGGRLEREECIDNTITQLHALWRQARHHEDALRSSDGEGARHSRVLRLLQERLWVLSSYGEICGQGEAGLRPGEVRVEALIPPAPETL